MCGKEWRARERKGFSDGHVHRGLPAGPNELPAGREAPQVERQGGAGQVQPDCPQAGRRQARPAAAQGAPGRGASGGRDEPGRGELAQERPAHASPHDRGRAAGGGALRLPGLAEAVL